MFLLCFDFVAVLLSVVNANACIISSNVLWAQDILQRWSMHEAIECLCRKLNYLKGKKWGRNV